MPAAKKRVSVEFWIVLAFGLAMISWWVLDETAKNDRTAKSWDTVLEASDAMMDNARTP